MGVRRYGEITHLGIREAVEGLDGKFVLVFPAAAPQRAVGPARRRCEANGGEEGVVHDGRGDLGLTSQLVSRSEEQPACPFDVDDLQLLIIAYDEARVVAPGRVKGASIVLCKEPRA